MVPPSNNMNAADSIISISNSHVFSSADSHAGDPKTQWADIDKLVFENQEEFEVNKEAKEQSNGDKKDDGKQ